MSDRTLYIQGKKVGTTNVSVFDQSMQLIGVIDVEVTLDTGNLQEKIRASTGSRGYPRWQQQRPDRAQWRRRQCGGGRARRAGGQEHGTRRRHYRERDDGGSGAAGHAQGPLSRGRPLRESRVRGELVRGQQWREPRLCHRTRRRERSRAAGLRVTGVDASGNPVPAPGSPAGSGAPGLPIFDSCRHIALRRRRPSALRWQISPARVPALMLLLSALETKGLVRRLAEPDLIALSGDTASFLAGGEYPVPTCQAAATVTGGVRHYHPIPAVRRAIDASIRRSWKTASSICASRRR